MVSDRYAKDYKLTQSAGADGEVSFSYQYAGPEYLFQAGSGSVRQILFLTAAAAGCFIAALIPRSHAMHVIYISIPMVFTVIPLWLLAKAAWFMHRMAGRGSAGAAASSGKGRLLRRREADLINNTYPAAAMFSVVLPCAALIGQIVSLFRGKWEMPQDAVFTLCTAAVALIGQYLFRHRPEAKQIKVSMADENAVKIDNEKEDLK